MASLVLPAPAKLNLFLHVTGRREDGYHTLESLFVLLDFGDTVTLDLRDDGRIVRTADTPGVSADDDIAIRAARMLQEATGSSLGVAIAIDKRVPLGGGLGGGSSDAATVLLGLNRLWSLRLSRERLSRLALQLGADVPFFIGGRAALAHGIGETLLPVTVPPSWIALVMPPVHVPTAAIFASPELTRNTPSARINVFSDGYGRNDLEPIAVASFPGIGAALRVLLGYSRAARMTGSGACVFAALRSRCDAQAAVDAAVAALPGARGIVSRLVIRHPLVGFA